MKIYRNELAIYLLYHKKEAKRYEVKPWFFALSFMPLNRERAALSMQNLYLPRDAIYAQKDSKDQGQIERCC